MASWGSGELSPEANGACEGIADLHFEFEIQTKDTELKMYMKDERACKDIADVYFNLETNKRRACKDVTVVYLNVDIVKNSYGQFSGIQI